MKAAEHALVLAASVAVAGGPRLRVAGTRAYFPGGDYVSVGPRGGVMAVHRGKATFTDQSLSPRWRKGWHEGLDAYLQTLSMSARAENPVSVEAIRAAINLATKNAGKQRKPSIVSAKEYAQAVEIAEAELRETAEGAVYGCGDYGCAAALSDRDGILKVTTDREEEMAVAAIVRTQAYEGFARIWKGPVALSPLPGMVWPWYAYTREVVLVTDRQMPHGAWNILRDLDAAREARDEPAYLRGTMRLWAFGKKHPSMMGIARTCRTIWKSGYMLGDFHSGNYGERDGVFVLFDAKVTLRVPKTRKKNPTKRKRKKLPEGVKDWWSEYADKGIPRKGESGYVETLRDVVPYRLREAIGAAIHYWRDPEVGPAIWHAMAYQGYESDYPGDVEDEGDWTADEIAMLIGVDSEDDAMAIFRLVVDAITRDEELDPDFTSEERRALIPEFLEIAVVGDALLATDPERASRPRLVVVSKELALDFIKKHHSALPKVRTKGLMYAIGVVVGTRLVAVGTAHTPGAPFRSRACPFDGILELSRIASDGSVRGASSMLASRLLDLMPKSGRRGLDGCLFVTYSLLSEAGTTYLALASKGIRPVAYNPGEQPHGARKGAGTEAKPEEPKIVWEGGEAALPPNWAVLEKTDAPDNQILGAMGEFYKWDQRERKQGRGVKLSFPKPKRKKEKSQ